MMAAYRGKLGLRVRVRPSPWLCLRPFRQKGLDMKAGVPEATIPRQGCRFRIIWVSRSDESSTGVVVSAAA
jgi:hypothetical protein